MSTTNTGNPSDLNVQVNKTPKNEIRVKFDGNLRFYVKYAMGLLNPFPYQQQQKFDTVVIKGMRNATVIAIHLAEILKQRAPELHQITDIHSTKVTDNVTENETIDRFISSVTITLSRKPLDKNHPGYQQNEPNRKPMRPQPRRRRYRKEMMMGPPPQMMPPPQEMMGQPENEMMRPPQYRPRYYPKRPIGPPRRVGYGQYRRGGPGMRGGRGANRMRGGRTGPPPQQLPPMDQYNEIEPPQIRRGGPRGGSRGRRGGPRGGPRSGRRGGRPQ